MSQRRTALVHGDYSPKNLLVDGEQVVVLDFEVTHWGDPRFDLAFCLCHLVLKAQRTGADRSAFRTAVEAVLVGYGESGPHIVDRDLWSVLACLLLARLEGDSPVEYLHELNASRVKQLAVHMLLAKDLSFDEHLDELLTDPE